MEKLQDKIEEIISGSVACENCNTPSGHKLVIEELIEAIKEYAESLEQKRIRDLEFIKATISVSDSSKTDKWIKRTLYFIDNQTKRAEESR